MFVCPVVEVSLYPGNRPSTAGLDTDFVLLDPPLRDNI